MASLSLYPQSETNLMSNRKVIKLLLQLKSAKAHGKNYKLLLQLKSAKAHGKNYIRGKAHLVRHLLRNRLLEHFGQFAIQFLFVLFSTGLDSDPERFHWRERETLRMTS